VTELEIKRKLGKLPRPPPPPSAAPGPGTFYNSPGSLG